MLDEVYNYKVEPKGLYWNDILEITEELESSSNR